MVKVRLRIEPYRGGWRVWLGDSRKAGFQWCDSTESLKLWLEEYLSQVLGGA